MPFEEQRHGDFQVNGGGVFHIDPRKGNQVIEVCSPLIIEAITRNKDGNDWGKLFRLIDPEGNEKLIHIRNATISRNRQAVIADLVHHGLILSANTRASTLLIQYIRAATTAHTLLSTAKLGWVTDTFVLPDISFGPNPVIYTGEYRDHGFGTAGDWKANIGKFCSGNSRLVFAASTAFAAPLLAVAEMEGGGFHFRGSSSVGKSTALEVAASVYGSAARYPVNWDTTKNALEEVAEAHNDCLMVIDELGLVDPAIIGESLYMIANGHGKSRMGNVKRRWVVLFLTSGEVSLAEHMAEKGKETKMGQEVRLLDIAADAGAGMGLFEELHSFASPEKLADHLKAAARQDFGTPLPAFLSVVTKSRSRIASQCLRYLDSFAASVMPPKVTGEVPRAIRRFALVGFAGELATSEALTDWKPREATKAAKVCFKAWMEHRRTFDPEARAVSVVRNFIIENRHRFDIVGGEAIENKAGYRKNSWFLILPDIFRYEVSAGANPDEFARALEHAGYLGTSGKNRLQKQERINGALVYFYAVPESILHTT